MPFVTAGDGTKLYYESEGDGFPLVFTHGNMGFGQQFFLQTRVFQRRYRYLGNPLTRSMIRKPRRQTCTSFCELWGWRKLST